MSGTNPDYYYAGGKKIALKPSREFVAVDRDRVDATQLSPGAARELQETSRTRRSVAIIEAELLLDSDRRYFESVGAQLPVFEDHGELLVVLPEVRIEPGKESSEAAVREWLAGLSEELDSVAEERGRWIVQPREPGHALDLANRAQEQLPVDLAQARMLRMLRKF